MVAMGSSTTGGTGAYPADSSWVRRFSNYYKNQFGLVDTVYNLGWGGASPYRGMPSSYIPPPNRQGSDPGYNVTRAVNLLAGLPTPSNGVVIVNYPTNGYDTLSIAEILNCLQIIYDSATRLGNKCYVTTTQPRGGGSFNTSAVKYRLSILKDSIINRFGIMNTINFYDGLYNPADSLILPMYKSGADDIHFNNAGHRILFERVRAKNVFNAILPVKLQAFTATLQDNAVALAWTATHDDPSGYFTVQRSTDGKDFESLQQLPVNHSLSNDSYRFTDVSPRAGTSYYRLTIQERGLSYYSKIVTIKNDQPALVIKKMYPISANKVLQLELIAEKAQVLTVELVNTNGILLQRTIWLANKGANHLSIPITQLASGMYYLRISNAGNKPLIRAFSM
jgi:hypothetical protein